MAANTSMIVLYEVTAGIANKNKGVLQPEEPVGTLKLCSDSGASLNLTWINAHTGKTEKIIALDDKHSKFKPIVEVNNLLIITINSKNGAQKDFFWIENDPTVCDKLNDAIKDHENSTALNSSCRVVEHKGKNKGQEQSFRTTPDTTPANNSENNVDKEFEDQLAKAEADTGEDFDLLDEVEKSQGDKDRLQKLNNTQLMSLGFEQFKQIELSAEQKMKKKHQNRVKHPESLSPKVTDFQATLNESAEQYCKDLPIKQLMPLISSPEVQEIVFKCLGKPEWVVMTEAELRAMANSADFCQILQGLCLAVSSGYLGDAIRSLPFSAAAQSAVRNGDFKEFVKVLRAEEAALNTENFTCN